MKSQLERDVDNDVKRVETATGQDIDLASWRVYQVTSVQQAQREIRGWQIAALVILAWLVLFVVILASME